MSTLLIIICLPLHWSVCSQLTCASIGPTASYRHWFTYRTLTFIHFIERSLSLCLSQWPLLLWSLMLCALICIERDDGWKLVRSRSFEPISQHHLKFIGWCLELKRKQIGTNDISILHVEKVFSSSFCGRKTKTNQEMSMHFLCAFVIETINNTRPHWKRIAIIECR